MVDGPFHDKPDSINGFFLRNLRSFDATAQGSNTLARIKLPLGLDSLPDTVRERVRAFLTSPYDVSIEPLVAAADLDYLEFAMVNPKVRFSKYKYAYGISRQPGMSEKLWGRLVKLDVDGGKVLGQWSEPGCVCTEPVFVPVPGAGAEDDGAVLSIVFVGSGDVCVVVLDAAKFTEMARVWLPTKVHYSFHSCFKLV